MDAAGPSPLRVVPSLGKWPCGLCFSRCLQAPALASLLMDSVYHSDREANQNIIFPFPATPNFPSLLNCSYPDPTADTEAAACIATHQFHIPVNP